MKNLIIFTFFTLLFGNGFCQTQSYNVTARLEEEAAGIISKVDQYGINFVRNFYSSSVKNLETQFNMLSLMAANSENPYAKSHIIDDEKNYTALIYTLDKLTKDSRTKISLDIMAKRPVIKTSLKEIHPIAAEIDDMLLRKRCTQTQIEKFFEEIINKTRINVDKGMAEVTLPYFGFLLRYYVPFDLIQFMRNEISQCINTLPQIDTIKCMRRKEALYRSPSVNLIMDSFTALSNVLTGFNRRITEILVDEVYAEWKGSYMDAMRYRC